MFERACDNVLSYWTYPDEQEIGVAARLAETVHVRTLNRTLLDKYRVGALA